jgi:hypothetical protein
LKLARTDAMTLVASGVVAVAIAMIASAPRLRP